MVHPEGCRQNPSLRRAAAFRPVKTLDTGPITNHVNIVRNAHGQFAYVTVGGVNEVKVFRTDDFSQVATIPVGQLPHGIWPSGDGTRVYVGLENEDRMIAIDTLTNTVIASVGIGQAPQAVVYVPGAVPDGAGTSGLQPLGVAGEAAHLAMAPLEHGSATTGKPPTSVTLFDQGLTQVLQVAVTGLEPRTPYVLALSQRRDGTGPRQALSSFMTNAAGAAIVNAVGPIRQIVRSDAPDLHRYLVIVRGSPDEHGEPVQVQVD
jgi:YVTN family beta-propeller protein